MNNSKMIRSPEFAAVRPALGEQETLRWLAAPSAEPDAAM